MRRACVAAVLLSAPAAACTGLASGDSPIAIELVSPPDTLRHGDTVVINVRVLNRDGDSIPGAAIELISLTPDTIDIDVARQAVFVDPAVTAAGSGRIAARSGNILSNPFRIIVPAP